MFRRVVILGLCSVLFASSSLVFASEIKELAARSDVAMRMFGERSGGAADRVLCIDGLKVFQTIAFGYGNGTGAAVSNIQLMEEKNGKVVPVRCSLDKK